MQNVHAICYAKAPNFKHCDYVSSYENFTKYRGFLSLVRSRLDHSCTYINNKFKVEMIKYNRIENLLKRSLLKNKKSLSGCKSYTNNFAI